MIDVLEFDNNYSWLSSKKVHYNVTIVPPSEALDTEKTDVTQF